MINSKLKKLILAMGLVSTTSVFATDVSIDGVTGAVTIILGGENTLLYKNVYNDLKSEAATAVLLIRFPDDDRYTADVVEPYRLINADVIDGVISFTTQAGLKPTTENLKYELVVEVYGATVDLEGVPVHNSLFSTEVIEFTIAEDLTTVVEGTLSLIKNQKVVMTMDDIFITPGSYTMTQYDGTTSAVTVNGVTGDTSFLAEFNVTNPPVYLTNTSGNIVTLDYSYTSVAALPVQDVDIIIGEGDVNINITSTDGEFIRKDQGLALSPLPNLNEVTTLTINEDKVPVGDYKFEVTINGQPDTTTSISVNYENQEGAQTEYGFANSTVYTFAHDSITTVDLAINVDLTNLSQDDIVNIKLVENNAGEF